MSQTPLKKSSHRGITGYESAIVGIPVLRNPRNKLIWSSEQAASREGHYLLRQFRSAQEQTYGTICFSGSNSRNAQRRVPRNEGDTCDPLGHRSSTSQGIGSAAGKRDDSKRLVAATEHFEKLRHILGPIQDSSATLITRSSDPRAIDGEDVNPCSLDIADSGLNL